MTGMAKVADTTFSTGKTTDSAVVDVYNNLPEVGVAQNNITSVLSGNDNPFVQNLNSALNSVVSPEALTGKLTDLSDKLKKGEITSTKDLKKVLKSYRNGAINSVLESTIGVDLKTVKNARDNLKTIGDNITDNVAGAVKDLAFGTVKGFADTLAPGLLDTLGMTDFETTRQICKNIDQEFKTGRLSNSKLVMESLEEEILGLSVGMLDASIDVINAVLTPEKPIPHTTNPQVDAAILSAASDNIIKSDSSLLRDSLFDQLTPETKELFVSQTVDKAAEEGSPNFIIKAAEATSASFVKANCSITPEDYAANISIKIVPTDDTTRATIANSINKSLSIMSGTTTDGVPANVYSNLSTEVKDVLKYDETLAPKLFVLDNHVEMDINKVIENNLVFDI